MCFFTVSPVTIANVVDICICFCLLFLRWSRDEAIWYLQNHTALAGGGATNEIDRYITWPGQACGYKVGELKIKQLRDKAETELGMYIHSKALTTQSKGHLI